MEKVDLNVLVEFVFCGGFLMAEKSTLARAGSQTLIQHGHRKWKTPAAESKGHLVYTCASLAVYRVCINILSID